MPRAPAEAAALEIAALAYDSRRAVPGTLFFCVRGFTTDGHEHAPEAVARGAAALVVERPLELGVPEVLVPDARAAMAPAATRFYGDPTRRLAVVGITGTNGKTTTAFMVRALLEAAGRPCALMGTVKSVVAGRERPVVRTTPEAIDLQAAFAEMLAAGDRCCAMEVSSHALELGRVEDVHFAVAVFTNLSRDHLDFHPTMEDYFAAKRRLFAAPDHAVDRDDLRSAPDHAVVNLDDPYGARLARELDGAVTFAIDSPADYRARDIESDFSGSRFTIDTPDGPVEVHTPLPGRFNVANVLAAVAAVGRLGVEPETVVGALATLEGVPGRFQAVDQGQPFALLVDYAHTPDSLENVLSAARGLAAGRVLCVFGCGGDRDRGKRPRMGAIAAAGADAVIVTSDNPRSEDPEAIVADILAGIEPHANERVRAVIDRREAIERAVGLARPGDVVVIAGKGHEQGQELAAGRKIPFDDVSVAREALAASSAA
jgi:UDP-N-acetylmuramoyl-L-alanyl-D-glutamate--2,6-diaminopimelate ligase